MKLTGRTINLTLFHSQNSQRFKLLKNYFANLPYKKAEVA